MAPQHGSMCEYEENSSDDMSDATNDGPPPKRQRVSTSLRKSESSVRADRRRGRGPSKKPCLNKNAQMARLNREKKKQYVESLEGQLNYYTERTEHYKSIIRKQSINERRLQAEVSYLKSVLKNKSSITKLLESLNANLNNSRSHQGQMCSIQNERVSQGKVANFSEGQRKHLLEHSKIEPDDGLFDSVDYDLFAETNSMESNYGKNLQELTLPQLDPSFKYDHDYTSPLLSAGEGPLLSAKPESLDCQITSFSTDNNSEMYQSLQDNLSLMPSSLNNFDISEYCGLDEVNALDFGKPPNPFLEENYFNKPDNIAETSGVCLHVNSNRVSLEFCASCQMNSMHSENE